jgi:hypothetical protein
VPCEHATYDDTDTAHGTSYFHAAAASENENLSLVAIGRAATRAGDVEKRKDVRVAVAAPPPTALSCRPRRIAILRSRSCSS